VTTEAELSALKAELARHAQTDPGAVAMATLEALIDVACGENPALRNYKRKWLYIGILQKLGKKAP